MKFIDAKKIDAFFNNVPLSYPQWDSGVFYSVGDLVTANGLTYECLSNNSNKNPIANTMEYYIDNDIYPHYVSTYSYDIDDIVFFSLKTTLLTPELGEPEITIRKRSLTSHTFYTAAYYLVKAITAISPGQTPYSDLIIETPIHWERIRPYWKVISSDVSSSAFNDFDIPESIINSADAIMEFTPVPITGTLNITSSSTVTGADFTQFQAKEYVILSGFTNISNNDKFRVISATATTLTLDTTSLINETGSGSESVVSSGIQIHFDVSNTNSIGFFRAYGTEINMTLIDNDLSVIHDVWNINLEDTARIIDEETFWFNPYIYIGNVYQQYPNLNNATLEIEIVTREGSARISVIQYGMTVYLGDAQYGLSLGIKSYSSINVNDLGYKAITIGEFDNTVEFDFYIPETAIDGTQQILEDKRDIPTIWIGDDNLKKSIVYGIYDYFRPVMSDYGRTLVNIKLYSL